MGVTATHQVGGTTIELELKPPNIPCRLTRNYVGDSECSALNVTFDDDADESNDVYLFCYNKSATSMSRLIATEIYPKSVNIFSRFNLGRQFSPMMSLDPYECKVSPHRTCYFCERVMGSTRD